MKLRIVGGSFPEMRSPVDSVIRQPIARADSIVRVMLSCMASSLSAADMEEEMEDRALKSTVFLTDLLISLLVVGGQMMSFRGKWAGGGTYQRLEGSEHTS